MNCCGWSADDIAALRRLVAAGWTDAWIGEAFDRARDIVQRKAPRCASSRDSRRQ